MADDDPQPVAEPTFSLKIEGAGLNFTHAIRAEQVATIMALALGVQTTTATPVPTSAMGGRSTAPTPPAGLSSGERISLREFLDEVNATKITEKILAIGAYLTIHEGQPLFSRDDVRGRFRSAGEPLPGNLPRDFSAAVSSGWIAEDHATPGSFYVTRTGNQALGGKFSPEVARVQRRAPKRRRTSRSPEANEE